MSPATSLEGVRRFLNGSQRAVLATINGDGSPHLVVVDYLVQDGALLLNGRSGRRWVSNLRRGSQATALVHDPADVQHWVSMSGSAELIREGDDGSVEDAKEMARRYGDDPGVFNGQYRVSWHLVPDRVIERI